jgi:hypothetical protein
MLLTRMAPARMAPLPPMVSEQVRASLSPQWMTARPAVH